MEMAELRRVVNEDPQLVGQGQGPSQPAPTSTNKTFKQPIGKACSFYFTKCGGGGQTLFCGIFSFYFRFHFFVVLILNEKKHFFVLFHVWGPGRRYSATFL